MALSQCTMHIIKEQQGTPCIHTEAQAHHQLIGQPHLYIFTKEHVIIVDIAFLLIPDQFQPHCLLI